MNIIDLKYCTLLIRDGGHQAGPDNAAYLPSMQSVVLQVGEGNLTYTERKEVEYRPEKGVLSQVKLGNVVPMDVSFDFNYEYIKGSAATGAGPTVEEALRGIGNASTWITGALDSCEPYSTHIHIIRTDECGDNSGFVEVMIFPNFRMEEISHDPKAGTVSVSGKCHRAEPYILRVHRFLDVSGTLTPDVTGVYEFKQVYEGFVASATLQTYDYMVAHWYNATHDYWIRQTYFDSWHIIDNLYLPPGQSWDRQNQASYLGTYAPTGGATGTATVSEV